MQARNVSHDVTRKYSATNQKPWLFKKILVIAKGLVNMTLCFFFDYGT